MAFKKTLATIIATIPLVFASPKAQALNEIGRSAADCMTRAVIRGVLEATSIGKMIAFRDLDQFEM